MSNFQDKLTDFLKTKCTTKKSDISEYIWKKYKKHLLYFIKKFDQENAEDILSEVMLKIFKSLETFKSNYSLSSWLYAITRNHCINYVKKKKDIASENMDNYDSTLSNPETSLLSKSLHDEIHTSLEEFDSDIQEMCFLRFYEDKSYKEIAHIMNLNKGTVKSRLFYAKKLLKKRLKGAYYEN